MPDGPNDSLYWNVKTILRKWDRSEDHESGLEPSSVEEFKGNQLLNAGITRLLNLLGGAGGTAFNAANTRVGVGDSATAVLPAQTDLQAGANKFYQLVGGAPSIVSQTISWTSTFASADGNFVWAEWGIDNGTASNATPVAPMLNRKVQAMGTKASGSTWAITVSITVA